MPAIAFLQFRQPLIAVVIMGLVYLGSLLCSGFTRSEDLHGAMASNDSLAGIQACRSCHAAIVDSVTQTAHFHTSGMATPHTVKGPLDEAQNRFNYNAFIWVSVERANDRLRQTAYVSSQPVQFAAMDIVIGSGRKGQTYLYWDGPLLKQLPVSYYTPTNSWCNSPGFPTSMPQFSRIIPGRCLECHGSYASVQQDADHHDIIDPKSIVYGISCERCHGPAAAHVQYQRENPQDRNARFIYTRSQLNRQQSLDVCALCHSGVRVAIKPVFSFQTGDSLNAFSTPSYDEERVSSLDVHGNQYGLLTSSKCFKSSTMTCSSCHNVHRVEFNQPKQFSEKCINCHQENSRNFCSFEPPKGLLLSNNCVDCHMPQLPSKAIFLQTADAAKSSPDFVRSHRIAIYHDATKSFLRKFRELHNR